MGGLLVDEFELRYADYSLSSDQEAVRDAFAGFFRNECPPERVRAAEPLGYDEKLWRQLADMGAASMGLPEQAGGDGAALTDLLLVAEEAGGALAPGPFIAHVAASRSSSPRPARRWGCPSGRCRACRSRSPTWPSGCPARGTWSAGRPGCSSTSRPRRATWCRPRSPTPPGWPRTARPPPRTCRAA